MWELRKHQYRWRMWWFPRAPIKRIICRSVPIDRMWQNHLGKLRFGLALVHSVPARSRPEASLEWQKVAIHGGERGEGDQTMRVWTSTCWHCSCSAIGEGNSTNIIECLERVMPNCRKTSISIKELGWGGAAGSHCQSQGTWLLILVFAVSMHSGPTFF